MSKHTPGPWQVTYHDNGRLFEIETVEQEFGKYRHLTNQIPYAGPGERDASGFNSLEMVANARLIAAAPELLEALKQLLQSCERRTGDPFLVEGFKAVKLTREAIAKAEGRE